VEVVKGPPDLRPATRLGRLMSAATGRVPAISTRYRAVVHAFV
jgi:hypothetical protein